MASWLAASSSAHLGGGVQEDGEAAGSKPEVKGRRSLKLPLFSLSLSHKIASNLISLSRATKHPKHQRPLPAKSTLATTFSQFLASSFGDGSLRHRLQVHSLQLRCRQSQSREPTNLSIFRRSCEFSDEGHLRYYGVVCKKKEKVKSKDCDETMMLKKKRMKMIKGLSKDLSALTHMRFGGEENLMEDQFKGKDDLGSSKGSAGTAVSAQGRREREEEEKNGGEGCDESCTNESHGRLQQLIKLFL
ncbi:hypothetical protein MRB53_014392 [Persea americana]|uniref:Uncharacterized protein n=1 Tax=Persea americana TaxID=3435 RepID=A0ACC2KAV1_PERAE|nr:hypothetical protein MRB53_014392 [Persea americana]